MYVSAIYYFLKKQYIHFVALQATVYLATTQRDNAFEYYHNFNYNK